MAVMTKLGKLTDRQREVFDFICLFIRENGHPPTTRDIGDGMHIASPNGVSCHLKALRSKGWIDGAGRKGHVHSRQLHVVSGTTCECCGGLGRVLPDDL